VGFLGGFFLGFFGWVFLGGFFNANPAAIAAFQQAAKLQEEAGGFLGN
jgi:hypothetical protein